MSGKMMNKLLVANRGEIAVRIIRAAKELGIHTTAIYSECDKDSLPVRMADHAVEVGRPPASMSYLNIESIVEIAKQNDIDAIHPGYGFLAENAQFAETVEAAGITFVGPSGATIRLMGDKIAARNTAQSVGVPITSGSSSAMNSVDDMCEVAERTGYPVLVKASAGGGGRGIRVANDQDELRRLAPQASAEAQAAFGDNRLFIEKFIRRARHIEVQVLGDGENVVHCFERDCSLQRRRQKVWEEAPAACLSDTVRQKICAAAVKLAQHVHYRGAGTVECLYDESSEEFYFLEMNTRIQVEHPVTECITGLDLIREMLLIAAGNPLRLKQDEIRVRGHSIECRINAEDPAKDFFPSPGIVELISVPGGPGVRFDSMLFPGSEVPPYYDSMLGKLIVWDEDRANAVRRMKCALSELQIDGINTTIPLHRSLVSDPAVMECRVHTEFLEQWLHESPSRLGRSALN